MDVEKVIEDLNKRFAAPLPEFYQRRIIFWHDEDGEFLDELDDIRLDNAKLLMLTGTNNYAAKKLLNVDDTASNYLVYTPIAYESQEDNWLLNMELYSEEFRADMVSMWLSDAGLPGTLEFRRLMKVYKKFFGAGSRRAAFAKLNKGISTAAGLHLAVMAAICGAKDAQPGSIIKSVITAGSNMKDNPRFYGLVTYGAEIPFWNLARQATGYFEGEDSAISKLLAHILLTATTRTLGTEYMTGLEGFISLPHQAWCYDFVAEWLEVGNERELLEILGTVEEELCLKKRFEKVPLEDLRGVEIFPCINECILMQLMEAINNSIIDVDVITSTVEKRRTLAWYDMVACYYEGILQVAKMRAFFLEHAGGFHTVEAGNVWREYTLDYYRMDTYYRQYHLAFKQSLTAGNEYLDDLFKQVMEKVEGLYTHWYLSELGNNWSAACADELARYGHILGVAQQEDFYEQKVKARAANSRVYVIISDAFRYEVAVSLAEQLRRETKSKVSLDSCAGIFPTVTKFGMAALLPHKKLAVTERSNGQLQVLADGKPTEAGSRDKILKAAHRQSTALKYKDIVPMKRAERCALVKGMDVVYIYHDKVDEASHTADDMVFPACNAAIEEIKNMVRIICNDFGGTHIYITADHGFLYTYSPLSEDAKVDKTTPAEQDVEADRRYLITRQGITPEHLLPVKFMDDDYAAFAPRESVRIKKKGGGLNFVHGGISLQEMVVPVVEYHYLRNTSKTYKNNKAMYDTRQVEIGLLSASRKISNMAFSLNFYQKEPVGDNRSAASYLACFVDAAGTQISDTAKIIADRAQTARQDRVFRCSFNLKSLKYDNTASYYLIIADEKGIMPPQKEEFKIDIAFMMGDFDFFG